MTALSKATITIKKIFDNGQGKPSKIIDTQDGQWKIWHDVLEQLNLKEGSAYDIGYAAGEYKGKPDNVIRAASGAVADTGAIYAAASGAKSAGNGQDHTPAPRNDHPSGPMGLANAFVSIGAVAADEDAIANLIIKCRKGHKKGWAAEI